MAFRSVLLALFVASAVALPLQESSSYSSDCTRECSLSDIAKFRYRSGVTYDYDYAATTHVSIDGVPDKKVEAKVDAKVKLHFRTPCEVTIELQQPRVDGKDNEQFSRQMTKFPLRAVYTDGVFQEVCSDRQDNTDSVNIKKGILSSLQNALPSTKSLVDKMEVKETDIIGDCPTKYEIKQQSSESLTVIKSKDHRRCSNRVAGLNESPFSGSLVKNPFIMKESKSKCKQQIERGIIKRVECEDINDATYFRGLARTAYAKVTSTLTYKSESSGSPSKQINDIKQKDLKFDFSYPITDKKFNTILITKLKSFCTDLQQKKISAQTGVLFSELVHIMDRVEEEQISHGLEQIRTGQICSQHKNIENIYLDAIAQTVNTGAIRVMVNEIHGGNRVVLYTWALYTTTRTCAHAVFSVSPLLDQSKDLPVSAVAASGSIIHRYCKEEPNCKSLSKVRELLGKMQQNIQSSCSSSKSDAKQQKIALANLKAAANAKLSTPALRQSVSQCFLQESAAINVRLQAAEVLSMLPCHHETTETLMSQVKDEQLPDEIRLFAYRAAVKCASKSQLHQILSHMKHESNRNVQCYVFTDLQSLQQSTNPEKVQLKQRLSGMDIPDYGCRETSRKVSKHYELSKFGSLFGSEFTTDLIYGSNGAKNMKFNLTMDLYQQMVNLGEVDITSNNLAAVLLKSLGEETVLGKTSMGQYIRRLLEKYATQEQPELEINLRNKGQDILYKDFKNSDLLKKSVSDIVAKQIGKLLVEMETGTYFNQYYAFQNRYDLHVSTIQGIQLIMNSDFAMVGSLNPQQNARKERGVLMSPAVSTQLSFAVGFEFGVFCGYKHKTQLFLASQAPIHMQTESQGKVSYTVGLPRQGEPQLVLKSVAQLMKQVPGEKDHIVPSSQYDPRIIKQACTRAAAGMRLCYDVNVSNQFQLKRSDLPILQPGHIIARVEVVDPAIKALKIATDMSTSQYKLTVDAEGAKTPRKVELALKVKNQGQETETTAYSKIEGKERELTIVSKISRERSYAIMYAGPSKQEQVLSAQYTKNSEGNKYTAELKTQGSLRRVVSADIDVQKTVEPSQSEPSKKVVKDFVLDSLISVSSLHLKTAMKYEKPTRTHFVFSGDSKLTSESQVMMHVSASSTYQQRSASAELRAYLQTQIGSKISKSTLEAHSAEGERKLTASQTCDGEEKFKLYVQQTKKSDSQIETIGSLTSKPKELDISLESKLTKKELMVRVESSKKTVLQARGPFEYSLETESLKVQTELGVQMPENKQYHVSFSTDLHERTKAATSLIISRQSGLVLSTGFDMVKDQERPLLMARLQVPSYVWCDFMIKPTPEQMVFNTFLSAPFATQRELQANVTLQGRGEGTVRAALMWDVKRDPTKKLQVTGKYSASKESGHLVTSGVAKYQEKPYTYNLETILKSGEEMEHLNAIINLIVKQNQEKVLLLKTATNYDARTADKFEMTKELHLETPSSNKYYMFKSLSLDARPEEKVCNMVLKVEAPTVGEAFMRVDMTSGQQETRAKYSAQHSKNSQVPLKLEGETEIKWRQERQSLSELRSKMQVKSERDQVDITLAEHSQEQKTVITVVKNNVRVFNGAVMRAQRKATADVRINGKTAELSAELGQQKQYIKFYPNVETKSRKYEIQASQEGSENSKIISLWAEYNHENRQKRIEGTMNLERDGVSRGTVNLDVGSTNSNVLSVEIKHRRVQRGQYKSEASLMSNGRPKGPKMIIDTLMKPEQKFITVKYQPGSQTPREVMALQWVKVSPSVGTVWATLQTPEQKFELGSTVSRVHHPLCLGYRLDSTIMSTKQPQNPVSLMVETCSPMFVKVIVGDKGSHDKYVAKLGLKSFSHAEISLMKNGQQESSWLWKKYSGIEKELVEQPVIGLSLKLDSSKLLTTRAQFSHSRLIEAKDLMVSKCSEAKETIKSQWRAVTSQLKQEVRRSAPELSQVLESIISFIENLESHPTVREMVRLCQKLQTIVSDISDYINKYLDWIKKQLQKVYEQIKEELGDEYKHCMEFLDRIYNAIINWINHNDFKQKIKRVVLGLPGVKNLKKKWEEMCQEYPEQTQAAREIASNFVMKFKKETSESMKFYMHDKSFNYAKSVLRRYADMVSNAGSEYLKILAAVLKYTNLTRKNVVTFSASSIDIELNLAEMHKELLGRKIVVLTSNTLTNAYGHTLDFTKFRSKCEFYIQGPNTLTVVISKPGYSDYRILGYTGRNRTSVVSVHTEDKTAFVNDNEFRDGTSYWFIRSRFLNFWASRHGHGNVVKVGTIKLNENSDWVHRIQENESIIQNRFSPIFNYKGLGYEKFKGLTDKAIRRKLQKNKVDKRCVD